MREANLRSSLKGTTLSVRGGEKSSEQLSCRSKEQENCGKMGRWADGDPVSSGNYIGTIWIRSAVREQI